MWAWICTDGKWASHLQAKGEECYLSQTSVRWSPGLPDLLRRPCYCKLSCLSLNGCHWILTDSISRPQHTDKVHQVVHNRPSELLLATTVFSFYAVVIWSDLLGDLQYCQDTLSWHPPNISDCSAGEWREAPKAIQCCLL